jgi:hypothetical protein
MIKKTKPFPAVMIGMGCVLMLMGCSQPETQLTFEPTLPEKNTEPVMSPEITPSETTPPEMTTSAREADADVTHVRAVENENGTWTFHVTVRHPDTGWEDYADGWDVVLPDGRIIKPDPDSPFTRLLLHPHENEQPFTRSQRGIIIPGNISEVRVRAHDLVDGFGGREIIVNLTQETGEGFEVITSDN